MIKIKSIFKESDFKPELSKKEFVDFIFTHIEQYGDPKDLIIKSVNYATSDGKMKGGLLLAAFIGDKLVGVSVVNKTGMSDYIPENIVVYIAVHSDFRNQGILRQLLEKNFEICKGNFKLHVDLDNPAVNYFEKIGFKKMYFDMRYSR